eukprot:Gb_41171 [translate_table: standard]
MSRDKRVKHGGDRDYSHRSIAECRFLCSSLSQSVVVVNPLRVCLAPLWLCLTAAADDSSAFDVNPPRLPSDEIAQISLSTQNDQNDYTRLPPVANFDVFINHRGKDVKDTLASHIYDLLQIHGVRAFLDREELPTGDAFPDAITEAIQSSSVHIAIFSPHYAESSWCLRELALMLKTPNATIIPVFYNVKPEELRWEKGTFAKAFDKHYRRYSQEMVDEWRAALQEVSNISGLSLSDFKGRLATKVVQEDGKNSNGFSGIIGIAGIGKTTLASALFNSIRWDFERASSIEDIEGEAEKNGLLDVQRKLLCNLMHHDYQFPDLSHSQAKQIIKKRFSNIDALIFLDNIKDYNQLDAILSPEVLLPGSTLIVTSRDSSIFKLHNNFLKYEMPGLNGSQSKELFCLHAFESGVACAPFKNLVDKFVHVCNGIPLALKICGRELYSESSPVIWESYLEKLTETMPVHLKNILQVSYARLDEKQKQILLDIAIFFHGENVRTIERIWEEKSFAYDLRTLEFKCMIKKSEMDVLTMHGAFRYLGRAIVDEESPNPGSRSRLWRPKDIKKVLEKFEVLF